MSEDFRSFSTLLLARAQGAQGVAAPAAVPRRSGMAEDAPAACSGGTGQPALADPRVLDLLAVFAVELNRLTARAAELLEEQAEALLADLAQRVLGRELRSSPAEIGALLAQTLAEFSATEPLVLRVSSADAERFDSHWPVQIDAGLAAGDFAVDVEDGTYDLKLQTLDTLGGVRGRRAAVIDPPIDAGLRRPVERPFWTGIKAIDGLITIGRGARIGIFGGPATGKSLLIEALVRGAAADAVVVGLIGERGGEAAAWMQRISQHATIVCSPSDRSPAERVRAAHVALAQASQLRRRGLNVLVVLDSLARFALAAREIALRNGEAVGRGGYPPSVFTEMTRLLERGGNICGGSVTLIATVLSDGLDEREPLSDAARSALDGHIMLSPKLARAGLFPAIDVAASASRTMDAAVGADHRRAARIVRCAIAQLDATRELRDLGFAHTDRHLERAVALQEHIEAFIHHGTRTSGPAETLAELRALADQLQLKTP
jgi:FliI/YscN family ATPase